MHEIENWLPVVGWEGLYEVSDRGRVRSLDRTVIRRNGASYRSRGQFMTPQLGTDKKFAVLLKSVGRKPRRRTVHLLVLEAFVGPRPEGFHGCHWNDDPYDNRLENLRWDTASANQHDKVRNGRDHNASKTHCIHGHEFTPENTYLRRSGGRKCRRCLVAAVRRYRRKKREVSI